MFTRCARGRSFFLGRRPPLKAPGQSTGVDDLRGPGALGLGASPRSSAPGPSTCRTEWPLRTGWQKAGSGPGPSGEQFTAPLVRKLWDHHHTGLYLWGVNGTNRTFHRNCWESPAVGLADLLSAMSSLSQLPAGPPLWLPPSPPATQLGHPSQGTWGMTCGQRFPRAQHWAVFALFSSSFYFFSSSALLRHDWSLMVAGFGCAAPRSDDVRGD